MARARCLRDTLDSSETRDSSDTPDSSDTLDRSGLHGHASGPVPEGYVERVVMGDCGAGDADAMDRLVDWVERD